MRELTIQTNDAGQRLDKFLLKAVPALPAALMYKFIRLKKIKVNRARTEQGYILQKGDVVALFIKEEFFDEAAYAARYLDAKTPEELRRRMLLAGQTSVADTFIAQMQDYLGDPGRTNVPGTAAGNWRWRMAPGAATDALADEIYQLTLDAGRCPPRNG